MKNANNTQCKKDAGRKTVGIIGGMGPEATIDLMQKIIKHTDASGDQEHVHCLVDSWPQIPSRTDCILDGGASPGPWLIEMAKRLENSGADFICIACNTAHNWYDEVAESVNIPVLHIVDIALDKVQQTLDSTAKKVGILCTLGTHSAGLYEKGCSKLGLTAIYPDEDQEKELMNVINSIKGGQTGAETRQRLNKLAQHMKEKGATALVLGCTELGVVGIDTSLQVVDAAETLATAIVKASGAALR